MDGSLASGNGKYLYMYSCNINCPRVIEDGSSVLNIGLISYCLLTYSAETLQTMS